MALDVKKKIRNELDTLVFTVAENYNEFITEDIPDKQFEKAANSVKDATDLAETNLLGIANEVVSETIKLVEEEKEKKATRLTKLLPPGSMPPPVEIPVAEIMPVAGSAPVAPKLEGPTTPLPREVTGGEMYAPPNMDRLVEQAEEAIQGGGSLGGGGLVDIDESVSVDHDLGLTVAEENRLRQGLPIKKTGPVIHVTGRPVQMNPVVPAQVPTQAAVTPSYQKELTQIGKLVEPYVTHENEALAMLASNVLSIVQEALGSNFTAPPPEEGDNAR